MEQILFMGCSFLVIGFAIIAVMNTIRKAKQEKLDQDRANIKAEAEIKSIQQEQQDVSSNQ